MGRRNSDNPENRICLSLYSVSCSQSRGEQIVKWGRFCPAIPAELALKGRPGCALSTSFFFSFLSALLRNVSRKKQLELNRTDACLQNYALFSFRHISSYSLPLNILLTAIMNILSSVLAWMVKCARPFGLLLV